MCCAASDRLVTRAETRPVAGSACSPSPGRHGSPTNLVGLVLQQRPQGRVLDATKDQFGMKTFGMNYGLMFTAWGVGGLILPRIAGMVKDITGKEDIAFYIASALMVCGALINQGKAHGRQAGGDHQVSPPNHPVAGA